MKLKSVKDDIIFFFLSKIIASLEVKLALFVQKKTHPTAKQDLWNGITWSSYKVKDVSFFMLSHYTTDD